MLAEINGFDFTPFIIASTYDVNSTKEYFEWQDANYNNHKELKRTRVTGGFELRIPADGNITYSKFINALKTETICERVDIKLFVNNENEIRTISSYYSFKPILRKNYKGKKIYDSFRFELEEY